MYVLVCDFIQILIPCNFYSVKRGRKLKEMGANIQFVGAEGKIGPGIVH